MKFTVVIPMATTACYRVTAKTPKAAIAKALDRVDGLCASCGDHFEIGEPVEDEITVMDEEGNEIPRAQQESQTSSPLPEGWSNPEPNTLRFERRSECHQIIDITVSSRGLHIETDDDAQYTHGSYTIADIPAAVILYAVEIMEGLKGGSDL